MLVTGEITFSLQGESYWQLQVPFTHLLGRIFQVFSLLLYMQFFMPARKSFLNSKIHCFMVHLNEQPFQKRTMLFPTFLPLHIKCPNPEKKPAQITTHNSSSSLPLSLHPEILQCLPNYLLSLPSQGLLLWLGVSTRHKLQNQI